MGENAVTSWPEVDYRKCVQETFQKIAARFEGVDPDVAECEQSFGVLTILFPDRTKIILSTQPSVRQLWVAIAFQGTAIHFNYDHAAHQWRDDKGRGLELMSVLRETLNQVAGISL